MYKCKGWMLKSFKRKDSLKRHILTCKPKVLICNKCVKDVEEAWLLKRHMESCFAKKKSECTFCGKLYERIDHFNKHIKTCSLTQKKKKSRMTLHESVPGMLNEDKRVEEIPSILMSDDIDFRSYLMVFESDTSWNPVPAETNESNFNLFSSKKTSTLQ